MTKTAEQLAAIAEVTETFNSNIEALKAAIEIAKMQPAPGFVFVWPKYWLGVLVDGERSQAVRIDRATITHKADRRVFTNGAGVKAVLMPTLEALEGALAHSTATWAELQANIA
jgi:hypothetical protein